MRKLLFLFAFVALLAQLQAQTVTITKSGGWFESAYVQWEPIEDAVGYKVFYSGEGTTNKAIDDQLIRTYPDYVRADILGITAGNYTIKVIPLFAESEGTAAITGSLTVMPHDRSGFAFSGNRVPGAYKADGTPKPNAVILYITENTKNTVSLDVLGANENPCVGLETILEGYKKGDETRPLIIRLVGQVTDMDYMSKGDIVIENDNNASSYITLEGVGEDAVADGWGIRVKNASNIEIRNIGTMNCNSDEGDNISLQQNNDHIWVHHNDFFYGDAGGDSDQAKGDGALDCKKSSFITFSYNHFYDSGKSNLLGLSEGSGDWYITYHHNWYDHSDSRHPRVRYYSAHVYNNFYDGNAKYGVGATEGSSVFVENNYFRHCKYPILISMQGTDVYDENAGQNDYSDKPTFSKEDGGMIKAFNNYMEGQRRFVAYGDANYPNSTVDFDAYVVSSANESVPSSVKTAYGGNTYDNFDTDGSIMYGYSPEEPATAMATVKMYAGRLNGGDFKWIFNNEVDDASYDLNSDLKSALTNYSTNLIAVQGDSTALGGNDGGDDGNPPIEGDETHNFSISGLSSTFYSISGNLSDSKGTVTYGGLTLTQCLKIESSTTIDFTSAASGTLTLVFNSDFNDGIYIDGTSYTASSGIVSVNLAAGSHAIRKQNSTNLFYMSLDYETSTVQYTLTLNTVGSGTVTGAGTYNEGADVTITATPQEGWSFAGWTGDVNSTNATNTIALNANMSAVANFTENPPVQYTLTLNTVGSGTVTGAGTYNEGSDVTITATPQEGWSFAGWTGDINSTNATNTIALNANMSAVANFSEVIDGVEITLQENQTGFCSVDGSIDANNAGYTADGFANTNNATGNGVNYKISVGVAGTYTITVQYANGSSDRPANIMQDGSTLATLNMPSTNSWTSWSSVSTSVTLSAGTSDLRLEATSGGGLANIDYITISGEDVAEASCVGVVYHSLTASTNGSGTVSGVGTYEEGTLATLTATASEGWVFTSWSGDINSTSTTVDVNMSSDVSVIANFEEIVDVEITIQENETGFCTVDGSIDADNGGFTGDGFANTDNVAGNGIDYSITVNTAGTYTIEIQYANGSSDRPAYIMQSGSTLATLNMPSTGSWTSWTSVSTSVYLTAGTSTLRLEASSGGGLANIDFITLTGADISAESCSAIENKSATVGITSLSVVNEVMVYPNPFQGSTTIQFNLTTEQGIAIKIIDMSGKVVDMIQPTLYQSGTNYIEYINNNLNAGIYTMSIQADNELEYIRLIVE